MKLVASSSGFYASPSSTHGDASSIQQLLVCLSIVFNVERPLPSHCSTSRGKYGSFQKSGGPHRDPTKDP